MDRGCGLHLRFAHKRMVDAFVKYQQSRRPFNGDVMQSKSEEGASLTVLVVDDEAPVRAVERRVLEELGYRVLEATNGTELVDQLAGGARFDLLIADLDMPVVRGDELARRIRRTRPDLRVLYVTGHTDWLLDGRQLLEGEALLAKPFSLEGLREAVSRLLSGTPGR
jgi:two-component system cell cycle sensor histidine kinase/response regulator CckA